MRVSLEQLKKLKKTAPLFFNECLKSGQAEGAMLEIDEAKYFELFDLHRPAILTAPTEPVERQFVRFVRAMLTWARSGFKLVDLRRYWLRRQICHACPQWDGKGWFYTGRCRLCGCATSFKLRLATSVCPDRPPRW